MRSLPSQVFPEGRQRIPVRRCHGVLSARKRIAVINKADIGTGFWTAVGVLLALFLWTLATGSLGKLRG